MDIEEWHIENNYNIDYIYNNIIHFINQNNIHLKVSIDNFYNQFIYMCYKGSIIPFKRYRVSKYYISKTWHNDKYDLTLGNNLFDLLYEIINYIQEYNRSFLDNIYIYSIQNFIESFFIDEYNTNYETSHNNYDIDIEDYD